MQILALGLGYCLGSNSMKIFFSMAITRKYGPICGLTSAKALFALQATKIDLFAVLTHSSPFLVYSSNFRHSKSLFSCAVKTLLLKILRKKICKIYPKSHVKVVKTYKKSCKNGKKMHDFSSLGV